MSIEDINYLKENSIKQSYTFLVDSSSRDRRVHPEPSEYTLEFSVPFQNIVGVEVVDVSIPKTMYNIDYNNNRLYYYFAASVEHQNVPMTTDSDGNKVYDNSIFQYIEIPPGDYTITTFLEKFRLVFAENNVNLDITSVDTPAELTNMIYFRSSQPFILDMQQSTMAEVLGFDLYASTKLSVTPDGLQRYTVKDYNSMIGCEKLYHSCSSTKIAGFHTIYAPGMLYLLGNKYLVLKCPEIEQHLYRSLSYSKYNMGLAKIRLNSYGFNDEKTSFLKVPIREFHPIGKLSKMTLRFETNTGTLYDFKGVNHNLVMAFYYYEPKYLHKVGQSKLNPDYNPHFVNYLYTQDEQEGESDDDDEYSRDNIQIFRKRELEYDEQGIDNQNKVIAYMKKRDQDDNTIQYNMLQQAVAGSSMGNRETFVIEDSSPDGSDCSDSSGSSGSSDSSECSDSDGSE
jgi:hypothetical protein